MTSNTLDTLEYMTANPSNNHTTMFKCKLYDRKNAITNVISNNKNSYTSINYYGSTKYFYCGKKSIDPKQSQETVAQILHSVKICLLCGIPYAWIIAVPASWVFLSNQLGIMFLINTFCCQPWYAIHLWIVSLRNNFLFFVLPFICFTILPFASDNCMKNNSLIKFPDKSLVFKIEAAESWSDIVYSGSDLGVFISYSCKMLFSKAPYL